MHHDDVKPRRLGPLDVWALVASPLLLAIPVYLTGAVFGPLFTLGFEGIDFGAYHRAGVRFLADPESLYADFSFMYPPPSGALFAMYALLPLPWAFCVQTALSVLLLPVCVWLFGRLYERASASRLTARAWAALLVTGYTSAPFFQTLKMGQVSVLVLLSMLSFLSLVERRPAAAAGALALGFWLKLYPVGLAVLGLRSGRVERAVRPVVLVGLAVVGVAVLLLPLVPLPLYPGYAAHLERYAGLSNVSALNQGVPAVLERLRLPLDAFVTHTDRPLGLVARIGTATVGLGVGLSVLGLWWRGRLHRAEAGFGLLALIAVGSSYGWEYTYLLALPLVWWGLIEVRRGPRWLQGLALVGALALLVPKPPEAILARSFAWGPRGFHDLFHARMLLVVLGYLAALLAVGWQRRGACEAARQGERILPGPWL